MGTTKPTAKAQIFFPLLKGNEPLSLPDTTEIEGKVYKVRKETLRDLLAAAQYINPDRVPEIEALIKKQEDRVFGKQPPKVGETRYYATNAAGYVMVNTKYIQQAKGTHAAVKAKGADGQPIPGKYEYDTDKPRHKLVEGTNGKKHDDINWTTDVAITYEANKIIIVVGPEEHQVSAPPSGRKRKAS